jgi:hypothetical protein
LSILEFNCLPTIIGSVPFKDPSEACTRILRYLKDIPAWPQLPKRNFTENMYVQFSQGFPGITLNGDKIFVDRNVDLFPGLERVYAAYLENDITKFPVTPDYAAGLYKFLNYADLPVRAVKGHVTGPVSWGMTVADNDSRAIAYDDMLADASAKLLKLKAAWMENELRRINKNTIIFVDEPYLHSIGSAFFALSKEKVVSLIQEVFSGIQGVKGIHCCGQSDWSIVLSTGLDILNFDAYNYGPSLALYPGEIKDFLSRGKAIAWGIIPNDEDILKKETTASLTERLEETMAPLTRKGVEIPFKQVTAQSLVTPACGLEGLSFKQLVTQSLVTPSCGLAGLSTDGFELAMELLNAVSEKMRSKWK